jgi:hypothetical protein
VVQHQFAEYRVAQPFGAGSDRGDLVARPPGAYFGARGVQPLDQFAETWVIRVSGRCGTQPR